MIFLYGVETVGYSAFEGAVNITELRAEDNRFYKAVSQVEKGINGILYSYNIETLHTYLASNSCVEFNVPVTVTEIARGAFYKTNTIRINLHANVLTIQIRKRCVIQQE